MNTLTHEELREFHQFVAEKLANGGANETPEGVLDEWRRLHPEPRELDDDVEAIEAALEDLDNGVVGMPLAEFDRMIRKEFKMQEPRMP